MGKLDVFLTNRGCLVGLAIAQAWWRLPLTKEGTPYGVGWFYGRSCRPLATLGNANRDVTIRLIKAGVCMACGFEVSPRSTGDHIIPRAWGGEQGAENYLPMCGSCNSSKGKKDLLEWWYWKGFPIRTMGFDALVSYLRKIWEWRERQGELDSRALPYYAEAIVETLALFPTDEHRTAFIRATEKATTWQPLPL